MTNAAVTPSSEQNRTRLRLREIQDLLSGLRFRAEANPLGSAIDLVWDLSSGQSDNELNIVIARRERRFPGRDRRGILPSVANGAENGDWIDGETIYDSQNFEFDVRETKEEKFDRVRIQTTYFYDLIGDRQDRQLSRTERMEFVQNLGGQETLKGKTIRVTNYRSLTPGTIYYYTAYVETEAPPSSEGEEVSQNFYFSSQTQASALATGRYGHQLFGNLPQVHQRLDTNYPAPELVTSADRNKGQLQRFLEVFEAHADMMHGFVDGLRDLHNTNQVESQFLPHLAQMIGWRLKNYHDEVQQRQELFNAPEVYKTVGTIPNIKAAINRFTGWRAEIHEYSRNVLLTFDASRFETLENGETVYLDGSFELIDADIGENPLQPPWRSRPLPQGSLNTEDIEAIQKIQTKAFDDRSVYTYDSRPLGKQSDIELEELPLYNPKRIRIDLIRDRENEIFSLGEGFNIVREILAEFLPINIEPIFFLRVELEEFYDTLNEVREELVRENLILGEMYDGVEEDVVDRIPDFRLLITNNPERTTVDTEESPVDSSSRTWHTALEQEL